MDTEKFFDTDIVSAVVKVFDPSISEVVHVQFEKEKGYCGKREFFHQFPLANEDPQVTERYDAERLEYALQGEEPLDFKQKYVVDMLT